MTPQRQSLDENSFPIRGTINDPGPMGRERC